MWNQLSSDFDHLRALNLIKLRCDSGISVDVNANNIAVQERCAIVNRNFVAPKEEPHDYSLASNTHYSRDILPNFEDHDNGGYNFKLSIRSPCSQNSQWLYSQQLNKLFIRLNKLLNIDISYQPKVPGEQLRVRAFICFLKEVSEPIRRCANHLSMEIDTINPIERESVLRCENPSAIYCGSIDGKNIRDRYSVLIPLQTDDRSQAVTLRETLAFKFVCQNSCIGRKQTSLMVLLENSSGVILSQRWFYLRICSCPKRDKIFEERHALLKCVAGESEPDVQSNNAEINANIRRLEEIKRSKTEVQQFDLQPTASGGFRLVMEVSNKEVALATIQFAHAKECVNVVSQTKDSKRSAQYVRKLKRFYGKHSSIVTPKKR